MSLPYNLQKLPPEALTILRYMGKTGAPASPTDMETGATMSARTVGKAIRRLVTLDYIHVGMDGDYELTTDGTLAVKQIAEYDGAISGVPVQQKPTINSVQRRLTVVLPHQVPAGRATDLFIGVNPPTGSDRLPGSARIEVKLSAVAGTLSVGNVSLDVPPEKAAAPGRFSLTPVQAGRPVRVRVDAFQSLDEFDSVEPLGGMYFDIAVTTGAEPPQKGTRAVGMDVMLKPSK